MIFSSSNVCFPLHCFISTLIPPVFSAAASNNASESAASLVCVPQSQPNPIKSQYPTLTTETVNGTIAILPVSYQLARSVVPAQYKLLDSYKQWLPNFPQGMFPAMLQAELDHDISNAGFTIPDFQRCGISFPFVDRLEDGYTPFVYGNYILISGSNPLAVEGAAAYGNTVVNATFDPLCDADAAAPQDHGAYYFNAYANLDQVLRKPPSIATTFAPLSGGDKSPYSLAFWKNVTNQPQFSNNQAFCDHFIRLFNSTVSTERFSPVDVKGTVTALPPFAGNQKQVWNNAYGIKVDNAFIENNYLPCQPLEGYHGTGSGD